jgi:hypothetical protein
MLFKCPEDGLYFKGCRRSTFKSSQYRPFCQFSASNAAGGSFQQGNWDNKVSAHAHTAHRIKAHIGEKGTAIVDDARNR